MVYLLHTPYLVVATLLLWFQFPPYPAYGDPTYGDITGVVYVSNYDGDTITVNIPSLHPIIGDHISIRVYGIDTPEIKGKCQREKDLAREAKEVVAAILIKARVITLKDVRRDKYFRVLATVTADGVDISQVLIAKGLAARYYGKTKTAWCK